MIHFRNIKKGYFISTNYKVMYSTLLAHKTLVLENTRWRRINCFTGLLRNYLIVRSPYDRIESYFKDKLRKLPNEIINDTPNKKIEYNQQLIIQKLGISGTVSDKELSRILLKVTWGDFVMLLPKLIGLEPHVNPQSNILKERFYRFTTNWTPTKILKMEDIKDMKYLHEVLGIDTRIKLNSTSLNRGEIHWSDNDYKTISKLYKLDFEKFGYDFYSL